MDERNSTITLEQARNGSPVPVINGVYLHSIYDPEKEAEAFVETFSTQLSYKNHILILGLGMGYHIEKTIEFLKTNHGKFKVTVLETNQELIDMCKKRIQFNDDEVSIIHLSEFDQLYAERSFVEFLMQKPCLLKHEASFALNKEKYTGFLTHKSNRETSSYINQLSEHARDLISIRPEVQLNQLANEISKSGKITGRGEFLAMTLNEIIKLDQEEL